MKVEVWSDVVCPWCYIGKRQLEEAIGRFERPGSVEVVWRSFELDADAPAQVGLPMPRILQQKYGMNADQAEASLRRLTDLAAGVGLDYHLDRAQVGNTFDAHRLIHLAADHGRGDAMKERLLHAYFTEGRSPSSHPTLRRLAVEVGLDGDEVDEMLAGDGFADDVRADEARATAIGVSGVPFFVVDETYGVSGAQSPEVLLGVLERAWSESHPVTVLAGPEGGDGGACADGACAV